MLLRRFAATCESRLCWPARAGGAGSRRELFGAVRISPRGAGWPVGRAPTFQLGSSTLGQQRAPLRRRAPQAAAAESQQRGGPARRRDQRDQEQQQAEQRDAPPHCPSERTQRKRGQAQTGESERNGEFAHTQSRAFALHLACSSSSFSSSSCLFSCSAAAAAGPPQFARPSVLLQRAAAPRAHEPRERTKLTSTSKRAAPEHLRTCARRDH